MQNAAFVQRLVPLNCSIQLELIVIFYFFTEPWFHVAFGIVGGYAGHNINSWEKSMLEVCSLYVLLRTHYISYET